MAEVLIKSSVVISPKSPLPCSSCGSDPPRGLPLLYLFAAVEVWNQAVIDTVTPSAACEAASVSSIQLVHCVLCPQYLQSLLSWSGSHS